MLSSLPRAWFRLDRLDKRLLIQAWGGLLLAQILIGLLSFRRLTRFMGEPMAESPTEITQAEAIYAQRTALAIHRARRCIPWPVKCLPQAVTAKMMLRRQGIHNTLYLGAAFKNQHTLEAHAWLRCGPHIVTGEADHQRFRVTATFAEDDL